jgi:hypothetical protein
VIENREQAIGIRRQIDAHDTGLFVDDVVEEARILMGEAVVILLPNVGGQEIVQGGDLPAPGKFGCDFEPFGCVPGRMSWSKGLSGESG